MDDIPIYKDGRLVGYATPAEAIKLEEAKEKELLSKMSFRQRLVYRIKKYFRGLR